LEAIPKLIITPEQDSEKENKGKYGKRKKR